MKCPQMWQTSAQKKQTKLSAKVDMCSVQELIFLPLCFFIVMLCNSQVLTIDFFEFFFKIEQVQFL